MGDMFSTKKNTTNNTVENKQVALQGRGQVGVSGSQITGNINVTSSDPEVVLAAIQVAGETTQTAAVASAATAMKGLDVANQAILISGVNNQRALEFAEHVQERGLATVDNAVSAAQTTALLATPQSPAAYAELTGAQQGQQNKTWIAGAILLGAIAFIASRNK